MRRNVNPKIWGPYAWQFLEDCADSVDEGSYGSYKRLIDLLPELLPCTRCRDHCKEYLHLHPLPPVEGLRDWLAKFRQSIKRRTDLEEGKLPGGVRSTVSVLVAVVLVCLSLAVLRRATRCL